jgi:hypothetical protein
VTEGTSSLTTSRCKYKYRKIGTYVARGAFVRLALVTHLACAIASRHVQATMIDQLPLSLRHEQREILRKFTSVRNIANQPYEISHQNNYCDAQDITVNPSSTGRTVLTRFENIYEAKHAQMESENQDNILTHWALDGNVHKAGFRSYYASKVDVAGSSNKRGARQGIRLSTYTAEL